MEVTCLRIMYTSLLNVNNCIRILFTSIQSRTQLVIVRIYENLKMFTITYTIGLVCRKVFITSTLILSEWSCVSIGLPII